ncbi:MAG: phosphonate C-P lyase system protein PhnL [Desulfobacteraceae bacterium]|nr:MAG: phosphonate C-P lyase system protein PhnL [Desulfobacteraceae bacterium]
MEAVLKIINISKDFVLHHQDGTRLQVLDHFSMEFFPGKITLLNGPSGAGKSTLLRMIYAGYRTCRGNIMVKHKDHFVDMVQASPATIYDIRLHTIGYVSQFLRVVPRVSALDTVIEPLIQRGVSESKAREKGRQILRRLRIPENLWHLSATTFSGGEQQRINLARGFIASYPIMLLDEPTASLDPDNRDTVLNLIKEAVRSGSCVIGVFHNQGDQEKIGGRAVDMTRKYFHPTEVEH